MDSSYSLSDIRAATDRDGYGDGFGFGGGGILAWFLIFALMGGNGFGWGGNRQAATTDEVSAGFANSAVLNKLNELTVGQSNINQNLGNSICSSTYELAGKIANVEAALQACCCDLRGEVGQVRYDMAVQNGDLKALIHSEGEATRNLIQQNKIETLQQQVSQLQLAQALCGIPRTNPYGYGIYAYPACAGLNCCGCTTNI